jgi:hypothetical protein
MYAATAAVAVGAATLLVFKAVHHVSIGTVHASSQLFCNQIVVLEGTVIEHGQSLLKYTLADDTERISIGIPIFSTLPALAGRVRSYSRVECGRGPETFYALHEQIRFSR